MDKLKMHTPNKADENFKKLSAMFPNAVTETTNENGEVVRAIDKDVLMQEINTKVVDGNEERYQFTWPDKKKSVLLANAPINKTLRPCREESVDFDNTENLYIEGDNLEVLKLLQETYLGKIKMIYIDPPYNTGNDFVYADDFAQSTYEYLENSGQFDDEGNRLVKNLDSNGRFHTDWLNMIYPRLKLAKDLLSGDGVIFISIDDNEVENLRKICDEVFGTSNFIAQIVLVNNIAGRSDSRHIAKGHEYLLMYQKSDDFISCGLPLNKEQLAEYNLSDEKGYFRLQGLRKRGSGARREDRPNMFYPIYYNPITNNISLLPFENAVEIIPKLSDGTEGRWRWGRDTFETKKDKVLIKLVNGRNEYDVYEKVYLTEGGEEKTIKMKSFLLQSEYTSDSATSNYKTIMEEKTFDSPKSVNYLIDILRVANCKESIVLDFFSGSATTAHAVMQLNAEDGGHRKFIMVQLPEKTDEKSEAYKAGYKNICEIGKERIRRAAKNIVEEKSNLINAARSGALQNQQAFAEFTSSAEAQRTQSEVRQTLDVGFRVLKLDSSNMKEVYYNPAEYEPSLFSSLEDNIKEDRTPEDLLFQVMLDLGVLLSSKIEETTIAGKKVFNVEDNYLIACFDDNVTEEVITEIAKQKPYYFVMRDSSMANDSVATNFEQIFAAYSPDTVRKVL